MTNKYYKDRDGVAMDMKYDVEKSNFTRAGEASSKIKKILRQLGLSSDVIRKIAVATYEAEINLVIHSEGGNIEVFIKPEAVEIYIEDIGPGIKDVSLAMTTGYSTADKKAREMGFGAGMGLPNMKRMADDFIIESEFGVGTNIKIKINL